MRVKKWAKFVPLHFCARWFVQENWKSANRCFYNQFLLHSLHVLYKFTAELIINIPEETHIVRIKPIID